MANQEMNNGLNDKLDAFEQCNVEAESRGGDDRPIQDNGIQGKSFNVQGAMTTNSFPTIPDQLAGDGQVDDDNIADFGLNENTEVSHGGSAQDYGIAGPAAGGGIRKNTVQ